MIQLPINLLYPWSQYTLIKLQKVTIIRSITNIIIQLIRIFTSFESKLIKQLHV